MTFRETPSVSSHSRNPCSNTRRCECLYAVLLSVVDGRECFLVKYKCLLPQKFNCFIEDPVVTEKTRVMITSSQVTADNTTPQAATDLSFIILIARS